MAAAQSRIGDAAAGGGNVQTGKTLAGGLAAFALFAIAAQADMGRVTVHAQGVDLSESAQKAIILHNGKREVLILGTELQANKITPIIRFIPFPAQPKAELAPAGVFDKLAGLVKKYDLQYVHVFRSKGPGGGKANLSGVEVKFSARLGAHDMTMIKVTDAGAFRGWVNAYFKHMKLPAAKSYPVEEGIVADYVKRGLKYFVLDYVEVTPETRFIDPVAYTFDSAKLYYPLKDTNSFGGKGEIDLFVAAPVTMCRPGSAVFMNEGDKAVYENGNVAGPCLNLKLQASTSALMVPAENDLEALYPGANAFFGGKPVFLQSMHYDGEYKFADDIIIPLTGMARAAVAPREDEMNQGNPFFGGQPPPAACTMKPEHGACKGIFDAYYFDPANKSCKRFDWGGCGEVPFATEEQCVEACHPAKP
jgi:hypothetical protein